MAYASYHILIACWLSPACLRAGDLADYTLWGFIVLAAFLLLAHSGKIEQFVQAWKANWAIALFILYSLVSVLWSVMPVRSIHTFFVMIASALTASIFAVIRPPMTIFRLLYGFTILAAILCLLTVVISPEVGIHGDQVWRGAWRGIFVHKNDLGSLMALGNGLSLLFFMGTMERRNKVMASFSYALTLFLMIMSRSTTALVVWFVLNGLTAAYFAWIKWGDRVQRRWVVYGAGILAGAGALSIFAIVNLSGKSFDLTGRVPLWTNLLENVISEKPWFGYGLETLWQLPEFQKWASVTSGWGDEIVVVNGHNGYIDILLYLGAVGLALLVVLLVHGFGKLLTRARTGRMWLHFFPLLTLTYFLIANIAMDYILEFESFHWFVLVAIFFLPPLDEFDAVRDVPDGVSE